MLRGCFLFRRILEYALEDVGVDVIEDVVCWEDVRKEN